MRLGFKDENHDIFKTDGLGRVAYRFPRTGQLHIILRGNKFFKSTAFNHYDDLLPLIAEARDSENKYACVILCDNGPDWQKFSLKVIFVVGRLWRDLNLDYICLVSYCAGDSRYNMIEHAWAPVTKWLVGLTLSEKVPGEATAPDRQTQLSDDELKEKETIVLENAMKNIEKCLQNREFDGFPVKTSSVRCGSSHTYKDEATIEKLSKAQVTIIDKDPAQQATNKEFQFLQRHSIQRRYTLEFIKCQDDSCEFCSSRPMRAKKQITFLREAGGCLFVPTQSMDFPEHFNTWHELATDAMKGQSTLTKLDQGLSGVDEEETV